MVAAMIAVLLPAGVLAAATVRSPSPAPTGTVGATALSASALEEEPAQSTQAQSTQVTVAPMPGAPATPGPAGTTPGPAAGPGATPAPTVGTSATVPTASTTRPPQASTGPIAPPGFPPSPPSPPLPNRIGNISPANSWSGEASGVSVRLRLDPPVPVAGQSARFIIDFSSAEPCCTVMLGFGDGTGGFSLNNGRTCGVSPPLTAGPHTAVATHTYATAGAYKANLFVVAGDGCASPTPMVNGAPQISIHSVSIDACLAVGPGTRGQAGCSPFPPFGPDTIVSPVIDPYCQVRSDCTKASTPRPGWNDPA